MPKSRQGFSLVETLLALLLLSLTAMLLVRTSAANAIALAQTTKLSTAVRMASEFSEWTHRSGQLALGVPLDQALPELGAHRISCDDGDCSAEQGAWHYVSRWRERLALAIPDVRVDICIAIAPFDGTAGWSCDPDGGVWVMKLGWPPRSAVAPTIAIALAPAS